MWQDIEEFNEALEGAYGPEEQDAAMQFGETSGLFAQLMADEGAEAGSGYEDALEREFQRVESQIGRRLTPDEEQGLLDTISTQQREEGVVPDFVADYGQQLASARDSESGREHLGAAAAERAFAEMGADDQIGAARPIDFQPANTQAEAEA